MHWLATLLLVLNDHYAKRWIPGGLSGKLSDVAGLTMAPLLIVSLLELLRLSPPTRQARLAGLLGWGCATAGAFALVQLIPVAGAVYETVWGSLYWAARAAAALLRHGPLVELPSWAPAGLTQDPNDLWALPAALLGYASRRWHWPAHCLRE